MVDNYPKIYDYLIRDYRDKFKNILKSSDIDIDDKYIDKIDKLFEEYHINKFIFEVLDFRDDDLLFLEKAAQKDSYENTILNFIVNKYSISEQEHYKDIFKIEDRENLYKLIKLMPKEYFNNKSKMKRFVKIFNKEKELLDCIDIEDLDDSKLNTSFKEYILDFNRGDFSVNSKDKLLDIRNIKYDYYKEKMEKSNNVSKIKNYMSLSLFGMRYSKFRKKLYQVNDLDVKTDVFSERERDINLLINEFAWCDTKKELLGYYDRVKYFYGHDVVYSYFDMVDPIVKRAYQEDLVNHLTKVNNNKDIIEYKGENFCFLVHKIVGVDNRKIAKKIIDEPEIWMKDAKSYLDVSLIDEHNMGVIDGNGFMFIFNDIDPSEIVAMGNKDICTKDNNVNGEVVNLEEKWSLKEDIRKDEVTPFDNHAIMKNEKDKNDMFMPSGVLCFDEIDDKSLEVSNIFDIPIILIDREVYLKRYKEKLDRMLDTWDYDNYYKTKLTMFMNIRDNSKLVEKYFSSAILNDELDELAQNIDYRRGLHLRMLSSMIKVNFEIEKYRENNKNNCYETRDLRHVLSKKL